jgi:GNAT superfamily N-acetyltransferase
MTKLLTLLWHETEPVGICVFVSPPISLAQRNRFFGRSGRWNRTTLQTLGRQLFLLQRVVLHPTYRGAGIATEFVRRSCQLCPVPWIETLSQMGHVNPFFERAGFVRVGVSQPIQRSRESHSRIYGGRRRGEKRLITEETFSKSQHAQPVYYIFDNREKFRNSPFAASARPAAARPLTE